MKSVDGTYAFGMIILHALFGFENREVLFREPIYPFILLPRQNEAKATRRLFLEIFLQQIGPIDMVRISGNDMDLRSLL